LPGTNALAYYEKSYLTAVKSFITFAHEVIVMANILIRKVLVKAKGFGN
jgi:hypothetical protein